MVLLHKLMGVFQQASRQMFTMVLEIMNKGRNNMLLKSIRLQFQFLKIVKDMFKVNLDLEGDIVQLIHVKWLRCGLKNN